MKKTIILLLIAVPATTPSAAAQPAAMVEIQPRGITTLLLAADVANGIVPPAPGSRVTVPPHEQVRLRVPQEWPHPIQWTKNRQPIPNATGPSLIIPLATSADSGFYTVTGAPFPFIITGVDLEVAEPGRFANLSSLVEVIPGRDAPVVGYVVGGNVEKQLLIRAVGPSLDQFGISDGAPRPRIRLFDGTGREFAFIHPAVVIDWGPVFSAIGAFPLPTGQNALEWGRFRPGAYTIQIGDQEGKGGKVLLEVYELPLGLPPILAP